MQPQFSRNPALNFVTVLQILKCELFHHIMLMLWYKHFCINFKTESHYRYIGSMLRLVMKSDLYT